MRTAGYGQPQCPYPAVAGSLLCIRGEPAVSLADQVVEVAAAQRADHRPDRVGRVDERRTPRVTRVAHRDGRRVETSDLDTCPLRVAALALPPHRAIEVRGRNPVVNILHRVLSPDASPWPFPGYVPRNQQARGPLK